MLVILKKSLLFKILSKIWQIILHSIYQNVEFFIKFFNETVNKRDFLKIINL